ncbi:MAG: aldehyde dehydrogenase family protein [Deltaproteobacteria bacterium]|nr:aldehyde dehydrogenase family protein [Deltaproteobacteria bacterium]
MFKKSGGIVPRRTAKEIRGGLKENAKKRNARRVNERKNISSGAFSSKKIEHKDQDLDPAEADVHAHIHRARRAQVEWGDRSVERRVEIVRRFRLFLLEEMDDFAKLIVEQTGKTLVEAYAMEILSLLEFCAVFEENTPTILADEVRGVRVARHKRIRIRHMPRGVIGVLAPWNFPVAIGGTDMVHALLAGNAVVVKPSEISAEPLLFLQGLFQRAGVPKDVVQVLVGGPEVGRALTSSTSRKERVDFISFTGSTETGKKVAMQCAAHLIPHRVELGGNGAAIVLPDADLDRAASALVWGAFANAGQVCAAIQRIYVHRSIEGKLLGKLRDQIARLRQLDDDDPANEIARLCPPKLATQMREFVEDALEKGGFLHTGQKPKEAQIRLRPVILVETGKSADVFAEECFGPVVPVAAFDDVNELLIELNASPYALASYVFSENEFDAIRIAERLETTTVMINDVLWAYGMPEIPWEGSKDSGYGVSHGVEGLRALCVRQVVHEERMRLFDVEPFWFPYGKGTLSRLRHGMRALYGAGLRQKMKGIFDPSLFKRDHHD